MRIWLLLWLIGMGVWLGFILRHLSDIPKIKQEQERQAEYQKYVP
jgi:hypothetical protein